MICTYSESEEINQGRYKMYLTVQGLTKNCWEINVQYDAIFLLSKYALERDQSFRTLIP